MKPKIIPFIILFFIGILLIYIQFNMDIGIMGSKCQKLLNEGYFEEMKYEWVRHDSCIVGNYSWDEECRFIIPWWKTSRCISDYDMDSYDEECDDKMWDESHSEMVYFNTNCVSSPIIKFKNSFVGVLGFALLLSSLFGIFSKDDGEEK